MTAIEVADIAPAKVTHEIAAAVGRLWRHQQMDMVSHQAVRVKVAVIFAGQMAQVTQVGEVVAVLSEARVTIVAPLNHVQRNAGNMESRVSGHIARTAPRAAG
jgi:hypothetical protein